MLKQPNIKFAIIFCCTLSFSVLAQTAEKPKPCTSEEYQAFDFWLGEWRVTAPKQKTPPATSIITKANNGCSIHEKYTTSSGYTGNSINFYDSGTKKWHQTWIDNQGAPLYLNGEYKNNAMVLTNDQNRITWRLLENKQVNQVWETTKDKGKTWQIIFNGFYTKK